ncbi:MAG: putative flap endonuclease-1-like 5' DNA nuclease [Verrucomicrobiales bacterium]|jgi:predicted flap endonuclease-1-like 5' DNA nuclease
MDGYTYLFLQTAPIIAAVALIFCLMGMFFGAAKYRTKLKDAEGARKEMVGELSKLRKGQDKISRELEVARNELRQVKRGKAKAQSKDVGRRGAAPLEAATSAAHSASTDLGKLYESPPGQVDDLKKVRGIARVMEEKLNAAGIYTYGQIARWSDAAATEFGVRLAIIGNVSRYNWREQCAKLHKEKYREEA